MVCAFLTSDSWSQAPYLVKSRDRAGVNAFLVTDHLSSDVGLRHIRLDDEERVFKRGSHLVQPGKAASI